MASYFQILGIKIFVVYAQIIARAFIFIISC